MKRIILITSLLLFALPPVLNSASGPASAVGDPCCTIVSIDRVNGVVTAKDLKTGETFRFEVDSRSLLKGLREGQKVWKDAGGRKVGILEGEPCCPIVGKGDGPLGGRTAITAANDTPGVTVIDGNTLIVKEGYTFSVDAKKKSFNTKFLDPFAPPYVRGEDKVSCSCIGGKAESCKFYVNGPESLYVCESLGDCECSIKVIKEGTDKTQDEAPGARSSDATAAGGRTNPDRTLVSSPVRWVFEPSPQPGPPRSSRRPSVRRGRGRIYHARL